MSEEDKKNRKFQYALTKAQVDFEYLFAVSIGMLGIGYAVISYYKDNLSITIVADVMICLAAALVIIAFFFKEQRFKDIKKEYIDS